MSLHRLAWVFSTALVVHSERLPIRTYTSADGLPSDTIRRIRSDSRGYLWFCTDEGVGRFDGSRFVTYGPERGLPDHGVADLLETRSGVFWLATGAGVLRFSPWQTGQVFESVPMHGSPRSRRVNRLHEDARGQLWVGTDDGLYRMLPDGSFRRQDSVAGVVQAITHDQHGTLWVGGSGLYGIAPAGTTQSYAGFGEVIALRADRARRLWVGTSRGLWQLAADAPTESSDSKKFRTTDGIAESYITDILEDRGGRIWVSTPDGLAQFDNGSFRVSGQSQGLWPPGYLAEDRDGNVWAGAAAHGVMKLVRSGFTSFQSADGLQSDHTYAIITALDGRLCTWSGGLHSLFLNCYNGSRFTSVHPNTPPSIGYFGWGASQLSFQDHTGEWWVATGEGLCRFPQGRAEALGQTRPKALYTSRNGLAGNDVFRMFEDSRGDVWIATIESDGGLVRWIRREERFERMERQNGIPQNLAPMAFAEDRAGNIWMTFYMGGVARYQKGRLTFFGEKDGAPVRTVNGMYADSAGRLWLASRTALVRVDDPTAEHPRFVNYGIADGLASNHYTSVVEDRWGRIYAGSLRGVDRFDPRLPLQEGRVAHFTVEDGLASNLVQICFRDLEGALWFGVQHGGLSRFVPEPPELPARHQAPAVQLERLMVAGEPYTFHGSLRFGPSQNRLLIEYGGISFRPGEILQYRYKLEGSGTNWSSPSAQRTVNYANLAPGSYRFLVEAIGSNGIASPQPATFRFEIAPPYWRRWWFVLLSAVTAASIIYAAHRYQLERALELERVRTRIATDLHDDIGSSLSQIALLSEVARRRVNGGGATVSEPLERIAEVSRGLVDSITEIVWAIHPHRDKSSDLIQRMRRFAADVFTGSNIEYRFETAGTSKDIRLGADVRRHIYLVFKEAVNNIVRHSGCAHASIRLELLRDCVQLVISDDGSGFTGSMHPAGHGLASMRRRAQAVGAELEIASGEGRGCEIRMRVPIAGRWISSLPYLHKR